MRSWRDTHRPAAEVDVWRIAVRCEQTPASRCRQSCSKGSEMTTHKRGDVVSAERRIEQRKRELHQRWSYVQHAVARQARRPSTLGAVALAGVVLGRLGMPRGKMPPSKHFSNPSSQKVRRGLLATAVI